MSPEKLAFALRPGIFTPLEVVDTARRLDENGKVRSIFIPDGRMGFESLEIVSSILAATKRVYAGSGVIRLLEHDPTLLIRRSLTLQALSSNRFILGIGTGTPGLQPGKTLSAMLERLGELKKAFQEFPEGVAPPETYIAALKSRIAERAANKAEGLLLNFCSPEHASILLRNAKLESSRIEIACYLKVFFSSESDETAQRLLVQEFLNYDSAPQYHEMFEQEGTADAISQFRQTAEWKHGRLEVPRSLLKVSLANPDDKELQRFIESFRKAGITLPVPYPYFPVRETPDFKRNTVDRILQSS